MMGLGLLNVDVDIGEILREFRRMLNSAPRIYDLCCSGLGLTPLSGRHGSARHVGIVNKRSVEGGALFKDSEVWGK